MADKGEILINSRQAAELLDVSPDEVSKMACKHLLPGMKCDRQWSFRQGGIPPVQRQAQKQLAAERVAVQLGRF